MLAVAVCVPLVGITLLPASPLPVVTTALFAVMGGRVIPSMSIIATTAQPALRGTFLVLNSAVQSMAMGAAAFAGGLLIGRSESGLVQGYWAAGVLGALFSLGSVWLARGLVLHGSGPQRI